MNTNSHECRWTHSNEKRHQNASATLLPWYDFVSFVDNPSMSMVTPPNQQLINPFIGVHSCPFVVRRFPWWMTLIGPSCPFVDNSFFFCFRQVPPPPCWADHSRKKLPIVFEDEPRMNTNRHEERWTSSGATTLRDESPPGARASRPPQSLSQSRPSPSPGSTGCRIAGKLSGNQRDRINRTRGRCTGR